MNQELLDELGLTGWDFQNGEKKYQCYGCAYQRYGQIESYIAEDYFSVNDFMEEAQREGLETTKVYCFIETVSMDNDDYLGQARPLVEEKLRGLYTSEYFQAKAEAREILTNNNGAKIIDQYLDQIEIIAGQDIEQWVGLVKQAYQQYQITLDQYREYIEKSKVLITQIEKEKPESCMIERWYYGFGSQDQTGKIQHQYSPQKSVALSWRAEAEGRNETTSGLISQRYCLTELDRVANEKNKAHFQQLMEKKLNGTYFEWINQLSCLGYRDKEAQYKQWYNEKEQRLSETEINEFLMIFEKMGLRTAKKSQ